MIVTEYGWLFHDSVREIGSIINTKWVEWPRVKRKNHFVFDENEQKKNEQFRVIGFLSDILMSRYEIFARVFSAFWKTRQSLLPKRHMSTSCFKTHMYFEFWFDGAANRRVQHP